jgi:hypothetical protein
MPLVEGAGDAAHSANVAELMREYMKSGKIGKIRPKSKNHAQEISNAIAYRKQRESEGGDSKK